MKPANVQVSAYVGLFQEVAVLFISENAAAIGK